MTPPCSGDVLITRTPSWKERLLEELKDTRSASCIAELLRELHCSATAELLRRLPVEFPIGTVLARALLPFFPNGRLGEEVPTM